MKIPEIEDIYELSPLQQGMLFHTLSAPTSGMYFQQFSFPISEGLNIPAFERAWQQVVDQNSILRTAFFWEDLEKPLQVVYRQVKLPIELLDWRGLTPAMQSEQLESYLQRDRERGFDLAKAPLMRLASIQLDSDRYQVVWDFHHLLLDGWSLSLVLKQVFTFYEAACSGQKLDLPPTRPYGEYIAWLQQQDLSKAETFWRQTLKGFTAPTTLGKGRGLEKFPDQGDVYDEQTISLSETTTAKLQNLARQNRLTLNTIIQGGWTLLLQQHTGETDIVFGSVVSGRPPALGGVESMVGMFLNTLPIRVRILPGQSLISFLEQLQAQHFEAGQYEYSPLVRVQEWSEVPRGVPLFESLLIVQNYPMDNVEQQESKEPKHDQYFFQRTNYPITLSAFPGKRLQVTISYDCSLFDRQAIELLLCRLQQLLNGIIDEPKQLLSDLSLLTGGERNKMLIEWNQTHSEYEKDQCVHQLFERQAHLTPEVMVSFENQHLTYGELNSRANRLAHYLRGLGLGPESLVGICVERSLEMMVGLLGILKAGAAYVPLDPAFPKERLGFMIEDAQAPVLLTQQSLASELPPNQAKIVCLDLDWKIIERESDENPANGPTPENLAYVIYTSGSTGKPKGVQIGHRALTNFLCSARDAPGLTSDDVLLSVTTLSFDIAALELYLPLITGASLVIVSRDAAADGMQLKQSIAQAGATVVQATPATWRMLIEADWQGNRSLKVLCGGEALSRELANKLLDLTNSVWNMYGPTETTIWSTTSKVEPEDQTVSIGRPLANTQVYLLDANSNPVPVGVAGELHIGGDGLARGYLNRPALTGEKFVPNSFSDQPGTRLYKSGDLARYRLDGSLEYCGRLDDQVKIRGFRIELGEIETLLGQHAAVRECVVMAREDVLNERRLVAYIVGDTARGGSFSDIRRYLQTKLPDYMVPANFVRLDALPLTPNGKVDRRALPAPDRTRPEMDARFVAPRTVVERKISAVWQEVLKVEQVGVHDNFFELGGHSLLILQLRSRLQSALGVKLSMVDLFRHPTVGSLAKSLGLAADETKVPEWVSNAAGKHPVEEQTTPTL